MESSCSVIQKPCHMAGEQRTRRGVEGRAGAPWVGPGLPTATRHTARWQRDLDICGGLFHAAADQDGKP